MEPYKSGSYTVYACKNKTDQLRLKTWYKVLITTDVYIYAVYVQQQKSTVSAAKIKVLSAQQFSVEPNVIF